MKLYELNEKHLFITEPMLFQLRTLVKLLIPFRDFSETISSEKYVTASLIKGSLIILKEHLKPEPDDQYFFV